MLKGCGMGRVDINIFKSTTVCVWKAKLILQKILSSPALCLGFVCSTLHFVSILRSFPWSLDVYRVTLACQQILDVPGWKRGGGKMLQGEQMQVHEERWSHAWSENIGTKELSASSLGSPHWIHLSVTRGGNGPKRPVDCTLTEILAQRLLLPDIHLCVEDTDFPPILDLITSCSGTQVFSETHILSAQQYQDLCRASRDSAGRILPSVFGQNCWEMFTPLN